jgi:hypothetical protein
MTEQPISWIDTERKVLQLVLPTIPMRQVITNLPNPRPNSETYQVVQDLPEGQSRIYPVKRLEEKRKGSRWNWKTKQAKIECSHCPFHLVYENYVNEQRVRYETCELGVATKLLLEPTKERRHCSLIRNPWKWYQGLRFQDILNPRELEFIVMDSIDLQSSQ